MAYKAVKIDEDSKRSLIAAINAEEENSYSSDNEGDLSDQCARNIDRYLGRNIFPASEGRSQVRDRSVYEGVQWMMPSLSRIFANGDDVVDLPPVGPEDMETAKQESQYLNHVLLQKNNWFEIFDTGAKDALITKRGYFYPYKEIKRIPEIEKYERQTPESLAMIMQDSPEVVSQLEYPDPDYKPVPQVVPDPMTGQPIEVVMPPPMLYDVEIRRVREEVKFCVEALPPERCKVSQKTKTVQVADACPYFEFYDYPTISELRQDGFEIDDDVGTIDADESLEETARNQYSEISYDDNSAVDPAMRRVKCRWIWVRHDFDQDGIAELQYVILVGDNVLHREECNRIPIAVLCPDKLPHRHIGMCPSDTAGEIEDIKTVVLRNGLDNLYVTQNPQKYADPRYVNLDDLGISRPGGTFRIKNGAVFGQNFGVMPIPFVFPQAMEALEYLDQVKENRIGVNRYFTGIDQNALNKTKGGMEMLSTMSAQRVEQIARHFANGIEVLCSLLHEIILKSGHKKDVVQLRGKWVEVDPTTWKKRTDFRIAVGFAAGNKDQMVQRLMLVANMQKEAAMGGLPIVTPDNMYETAMELTKATDMQAPQRFWTEPSKAPQKGPPPPDATVMAAETIKSQTTLQVKDAELRTEKELKAAELEAEAKKTLLIETNKREIEEMKLARSVEAEREKSDTAVKIKNMDKERGSDEIIGARTRAQDAEKKVGEIAQQMNMAVGDLQGVIDHMATAPRTIKRGPDGLVQGSEIVGPNGRVLLSRKVRRGKNGKAEGIDITGPDGEVIASRAIKRDSNNRIVGEQ